jgi:hypothetical protein
MCRQELEYHRHLAFVGTLAEVVADCCCECPPVPVDVDPVTLQAFVSGPLKWVVDNPGAGNGHALNQVFKQL